MKGRYFKNRCATLLADCLKFLQVVFTYAGASNIMSINISQHMMRRLLFQNSCSHRTWALLKRYNRKNLKINGRREIRPTWMKPVPTLWKNRSRAHSSSFQTPRATGMAGPRNTVLQKKKKKKKKAQFVLVAAGVCLSGCTCACGWDRFGNSSYISRDRGRKRDETVNENLGEVMLAWGEKS